MILAALSAYVLIQLGIAAWAGRQTEDAEDYLVAGRSLGTWQVAMSIFATWFAAETVIATSAEVAQDGLAGARVEPFGYGLGIVILALAVAGALRKGGHLTLAGFLGSHFGKGVQAAASVVIAISAIIWAGAQLNALAVIVTGASQIPFVGALMISVGLVLTYTWLGGLKGDVATDVLQGLVIIVSLLILLVLLVLELGGPGAAFSAIPEGALAMRIPGESLLARMELWLVPIVGTIVAQEAVSRVLGAQSAAVARNGALLGAGIYLLVGGIPVLLGLMGQASTIALAEGDGYFPSLAEGLLPSWLFVIVSGALISAILSSVDSALLSVSAVTTEAVLSGKGRNTGKPGQLRLARFATTGAATAAALIAVSGDSLRDIVLTASGVSGLIFVPVLGALFVGKAGRAAALASLIAGFTAMVILEWILGTPGAFLYAQAAAAGAFVITLTATRRRA